MTNEQISTAISKLTSSLDRLGNGNAATDMGAIENLAKELKDGTQRIASAIESLADAIREGGAR